MSHNQHVMLVHVGLMLILKSYVLEFQVHMSECRKCVSICIELHDNFWTGVVLSIVYNNYYYFFFSIVETIVP